MMCAIGYIAFCYVSPIVILYNNYDMYSAEKLTIPAIFILIIALIGAFKLAKYLCGGKYSFAKKITKGALLVILPLSIAYMCANYVSENITLIKDCLRMFIISISVGIVLNPFPKWVSLRDVETK